MLSTQFQWLGIMKRKSKTNFNSSDILFQGRMMILMNLNFQLNTVNPILVSQENLLSTQFQGLGIMKRKSKTNFNSSHILFQGRMMILMN
jgi:hypothetical protein